MVRQGNARNNKSRQAGSTGRRPGGKSVSAVYRRRRLFVGIGLLMVLAMTVGGFAALSGAMAGGTRQVSSQSSDSPSTTTPAAVASPSATPTATAPPPTPTCDQNLVTVSASTDKPRYADGENPLLTLKVTNGGTVPCEVNIGTSQMEFLVTSGSDRIFSSKDCQTDSEDLIKTLAPGQSETANFPWPRNRSVQGCTAVAAKPGAGGAYYVFTAKLGPKVSPKAVFQLG
jgi:hypothetical protein